MRAKRLIVLLLACSVVAGCAASQLKARKDNAWLDVSQSMPDRQDANSGSYAHPLRGAAFVLYPVGVVLDYVLVRPFYLLAGLAPEWFGLATDDAQDYQAHFPELSNSRDAPGKFPRIP